MLYQRLTQEEKKKKKKNINKKKKKTFEEVEIDCDKMLTFKEKIIAGMNSHILKMGALPAIDSGEAKFALHHGKMSTNTCRAVQNYT